MKYAVNSFRNQTNTEFPYLVRYTPNTHDLITGELKKYLLLPPYIHLKGIGMQFDILMK